MLSWWSWRNVYELDKALSGYTHLHLQRNHLKVSKHCSKCSKNAKASFPPAPSEIKPPVYQKMLVPVISTAVVRSW